MPAWDSTYSCFKKVVRMTVITLNSRLAIGLAICVSLCAVVAAAQDNALARAKDLYHTAAYDEALSLLDTMKSGNSPGENSEIAGYRVFCLLALGRVEDARKGIETIIRQNPNYLPSDEEASPRILAAFEEVRRALLPVIVRDRYQQAKASFDRKDFSSASDQFADVIKMLDDPALASMPSRTDLRTLASGFVDLSQTATANAAKAQEPGAPASTTRAATPAGASAQTPAALPPTAGPQPPAVGSASLSAPPAPKEPIIYGLDNTDVTPPVAISRSIPPWTPNGTLQAQAFLGAVEVVVTESGSVASVVLKRSLHPAYDPSLVRAARAWKFKPAMKQGQPVRYRYLIEVRLQPKG
jgi:TonB family protein